jgi:hypothetical protein
MHICVQIGTCKCLLERGGMIFQGGKRHECFGWDKFFLVYGSQKIHMCVQSFSICLISSRVVDTDAVPGF